MAYVDFQKVDLGTVADYLETDNQNQNLWGLGGFEFAEKNIKRNLELLECIESENYEGFDQLLDADADWYDDFIMN